MGKIHLLPFIFFIFLITSSLAFSYTETKNSEDVLELSEILAKGEFSFSKFTIKAKIYNESLSFVFEEPTKSFFSRYLMKYEPKDNSILLIDSNGNGKQYYLKVENKLNESQEGEEEFKSYIVKFKDPPLAVKREELKRETERKINETRKALTRIGIQTKIEDVKKSLEAEMKKALVEHENKIKSVHEAFKERVKNITELTGKTQFKEYKNVFNGITLRLPKSSLDEIKSLPYVDEVYEDRKIKVFLTNSTSQINATEVWKLLDIKGINVTGFNVTIAIIDTGIDYTHPDLGNCTQSQFLNKQCSKVIGGYDFVNGDNDPADDHGHGTHCAGIAAGNGTLKGVAPGAKLLAYKVLDWFGDGEESDVIAAIERAVNDSADIISMSLGTYAETPNNPLSQAVENAVSSNVVVVVAAGNGGPGYNTIATPANALRSIAVGAVNKTNSIADFSSRGPVVWKNRVWLKPDVVAPGVDICSAQFDSVYSEYRCIDNNHISASGTSMAAPHVAGVVALLKQYHKGWTVDDIRSAIITTSKDLGYDMLTQGSGLVNALNALNASILIDPCQINSSFVGNVTPVFQIPIKIKNLRNYQISVNLSVENATTEYGGSYNISYLNTSNLTINANSESSVLFTINLTNQGGVLFGKIIIKAEGKNYTVPYIASWLTDFNVSVVKPGAILYPDIYIHDDEIKSRSRAYQLFDFIGPNYTFSAPSNKNITVYAIGDYLDASLTYIITKRVYIPPEGTNITLNLTEDSKQFTINGTSFNGSKMIIDGLEFGFSTYKSGTIPFRLIYKYLIPKIGNQIIYLSNKPEAPYDIDTIVAYDAIPISEYDVEDVYTIADEQYFMGWMIHNINSTTPTTLSYTKNDVAEYSYSYDYPAYEPYIYYDFSVLLPPVPNNLTESRIIFGYSLAVPSNRTYYVMGINPPPDIYKNNWSFFNTMKINYLQYLDPFGYAHLEQYTPKERAYYSINPVPGAKDSFSFGKAPYTPTSFLVNNSSLRLSDYLMKGYLPKIHLWRDASKFGSLELIPRYQIFLNNSSTPVFSGNLTDEKGTWNHTFLNYSFEFNGTYFVNLTIPSNYPVWNITRIEAVFRIPGDDVQPAVLNHIEAKPYFEVNKSYNISMNITDSLGIKNVSVEYRTDSNWIQLTVQNNSEIYKTNLTINSSVTSFDLKISINDTSDNQINYTISPLALIGRNVSITLKLDSTDVFQGGVLPVSGTIKENEVGMTGLKINFFINNTSVGKAMSSYGYYSGLAKLSCDSPSTPNITAKFYGTGTYMASEILNESSINIVPLNFTVDENVSVGSVSLINASCSGAYLMINKSSFFYSKYMSNNIFSFTPHHYGNYTVTLNTSCGENISKNIFANITSPPSIIYVDLYPKYPTVGSDILAYVSTYSQDQHNLVGNLSNSSMESALDLNFLNMPAKDYYTNEIYNYSYCFYCWYTTINNLQLGAYNISLEISDAINQKNKSNTTFYVFPPINLSFNITDSSGQPASRRLILGFDTDYNYYEYQIGGYKKIESLPNVSYFNKSFHVSIKNYNGSDYQIVRFENSTVQPNMNITSDYLEEKKEFPDKILYSIYSYKPSWNFSKVYVKFIYYDVSKFNMHNFSKSTIYSCKSYDFNQKTCNGNWVNITKNYYSSYYSTYVEGETDDPQAVAFGEPQTCGDGYCSPYESCSSCPSDCGTCPPTTTITTTIPEMGELFTTTTVQTTSTTTTIEAVQPCPFECCVNEANFTDKPCSPGSECVNHACVLREEERAPAETNLLLIILGIAIVFVLVLVFTIILNKRSVRATPEKIKNKQIETKPEEMKTKESSIEKEKRIGNMIKDLSENIRRLKDMGYDTSKLESELKLAETAFKKGSLTEALIHIENLNGLIESLEY